MFFVLVTAYMALLAHAFVPHHHHGEHTAFLNHKDCPHGHHDHHEHEDTAAVPNTCHGGECETLKNVWVKDSQQKVSLQPAPENPDLNYFLGADFPFLWEGWRAYDGLSFRDVPISFYNLSVESNNLRGPPVQA